MKWYGMGQQPGQDGVKDILRTDSSSEQFAVCTIHFFA